MRISTIYLTFCLATVSPAGWGQVPSVKTVAGGESAASAASVRQVVVGRGVSWPDPFPGFGGTVAWAGVERAKDGALVVAFNAGYWHASWPTPSKMSPAVLEKYYKIGMPRDFSAPTGGRLMFVRSTDHGKTWSKPETLIDTPADDRQAGLLTLPDGTMLASFFTSYGDDVSPATHTWVVRSFDNGRTWEQKPIAVQRKANTPFRGDASDGPPVLLKDGSILLTLYGVFPASEHHTKTAAAFFISKNRGRTWKLLSELRGEHDLEENDTAELPDGRWVMVARPEGDLFWSSDHGKTWSAGATFGLRMYAPTLYVLRDGTLVCLYGSYAPGNGGLRVIFSTDGGQTWIAPAKDHGFLVDGDAYGYGAGVLLPDDSLYLIYQRTGSHRTADAQDNSLLSLRLRVRADHSGIELLPPVY
jgi:hypothetical protein